MQTKMNVKLANIFKAAQKIREASYDNAAADKATAADDAERTANPDNIYAGMGTDYSSFYRKTFEEAAAEACAEAGEPEMAEVVHLLMYSLWNDIEMWADEQLGIQRPAVDNNSPGSLFAHCDACEECGRIVVDCACSEVE